jgi:hypothetical protein
MTLDTTGIFFTEPHEYIMNKVHFFVTWTQGTLFCLLLTILALHYRFPKSTRKSIRTILLMCLRNSNGDPLFSKCLLTQLPKDLVLFIIQLMNVNVFIWINQFKQLFAVFAKHWLEISQSVGQCSCVGSFEWTAMAT